MSNDLSDVCCITRSVWITWRKQLQALESDGFDEIFLEEISSLECFGGKIRSAFIWISNI